MISEHAGGSLAACYLQLLPGGTQAFIDDVGGDMDFSGSRFCIMALQQQSQRFFLILIKLVARRSGHGSIICHGVTFGKKEHPNWV